MFKGQSEDIVLHSVSITCGHHDQPFHANQGMPTCRLERTRWTSPFQESLLCSPKSGTKTRHFEKISRGETSRTSRAIWNPCSIAKRLLVARNGFICHQICLCMRPMPTKQDQHASYHATPATYPCRIEASIQICHHRFHHRSSTL